MKVLISLVLTISAVLCDQPSVEVQRVQVYEVPYQPSGWRPAAITQLPQRLTAFTESPQRHLPVKPAENFKVANFKVGRLQLAPQFERIQRPASLLQLPNKPAGVFRRVGPQFERLQTPASLLQLPNKPAGVFRRVGPRFERIQRPASLLQLPNKPAGLFRAPQFARLETAIPATKYGPPSQEYGPPPEGTTEAIDATTTELPTTTAAPSSKLQDKSEKFVERGIYYIYHPNGLLQKVVYATKDDIEKMEYSARLRYQDVEPIRDPIYTYNPETRVLERLRV